MSQRTNALANRLEEGARALAAFASALTEAEWQALCRVMERPAWTGDERFATLRARQAHEDELERRLAEWTREWDAEALMEALQAAGVAICPRGT